MRRSAVMLMAFALSACAAGGPVPDGAPVEIPVRAGKAVPPLPVPDWAPRLTAADGSAVTVAAWGAERPRAVILALHGYGDHGRSTFAASAEAWAAEGIATLAPDQRGFGANASRGRWPGADALIADARGHVARVREAFPCVPLVLLGHSMGGGIALAAAEDSGADALVLAAPAIWGGDALNPLHRLLAWTAAMTIPETRLSGRGVVRIQASDNIEALRALGRDPLYLSPPSAREIFGLVRVTDRAAGAAPLTTVPALMLLGEKDQIVPNDTVTNVFTGLKGPHQIIRYPDGWHLLFRDLQAARVHADVGRFALDAPAPAGCPS